MTLPASGPQPHGGVVRFDGEHVGVGPRRTSQAVSTVLDPVVTWIAQSGTDLEDRRLHPGLLGGDRVVGVLLERIGRRAVAGGGVLPRRALRRARRPG